MKAVLAYLGWALYILILSLLFAVVVIAFTVAAIDLLGKIG